MSNVRIETKFDGTFKSLKPLLDGTVGHTSPIDFDRYKGEAVISYNNCVVKAKVGDTIKVLENGDIEVYRTLKMSL